MKKMLFILAALLLMILPAIALAEGELPTDPFTWEQLVTIGGATLAVLLIVQVLKLPIDKIWKIPTRIVVYIFSLIVLLLATHFTTGLSVSNGILAAFNALIVALAAMGAYEVTFRKLIPPKVDTEADTEDF